MSFPMEVINLSYSQQSNHVVTHLYNNQEAHIPYTKNATLKHKNNVFLMLEKSGSNVNYSPRALLFDVRNGNGALNKYEYFENVNNVAQDYFNDLKPKQKNQYQLNLDQGINNNFDLLNVSNTTFWSDYNKLIYNPRSLTTLPNFDYPDTHKHFQNLKFDNFQIGEQEYVNSHYDVNNFRYFLEKCDHFQGLQSFIDIDSGWSGYSNAMIQEIMDEYFNDNNKVNLWIYGMMKHDPKVNMISRIKSIVELSKQASLFFPILPPTYSSNLLNQSFDPQSPWHTSSLPALFVNGLWDSISQLNSTSMSTIEDNLLRGANQFFINEIKISPRQSLDSQIADVDINDYLNDQPSPENTKSDDIHLTENTSSSTYFSQNYILPYNDGIDLPKDGVVNTYKTNNINEMTKLDSFPNILTSKDFYFQFHVSSQYKETLKNYRKIINNIRPNNDQQMELVEDKYELIEDISTIVEEYTHGYDETDEEGDDLW